MVFKHTFFPKVSVVVVDPALTEHMSVLDLYPYFFFCLSLRASETVRV